LNTATIADEGLYTIECTLFDGAKHVAEASGLLELVTPPDYGLPHEESRP